MNATVSDEKLNAFVDGELDVAESEALLARLREDAELANRVCRLRNLKSMVALAYADPPAAGRPTRGAGLAVGPGARYAAGVAILALGLGAGWLVRDLQDPGVARQARATPDAIRLVRAADTSRVMLHVDSAEPRALHGVLDRAEGLLAAAEREGRTIEIEVIANSRGLDLLRADYSPEADRIARLARQHANVHFIACNQSIARLKSEGKTVVLLPEAKVAPTAIGEIVTRLQQGWTYVKV
jgi:hypothetical protein